VHFKAFLELHSRFHFQSVERLVLHLENGKSYASVNQRAQILFYNCTKTTSIFCVEHYAKKVLRNLSRSGSGAASGSRVNGTERWAVILPLTLRSHVPVSSIKLVISLLYNCMPTTRSVTGRTSGKTHISQWSKNQKTPNNHKWIQLYYSLQPIGCTPALSVT